MIPFLLVLLLIIYFVFSDLMPILKKSQGKIFWLYSSLMLIAMVLNVMILVNFKFPIISVSIKRFLKMFLNIEA